MAASAKAERVTREIGPLSLRGSFSPGTINEEKRTVEVVWTTGARVLRGFFETYWEELSLSPKHVRMDRLRNGAPLLDSHNSYGLASVLGVVESARLGKGEGTAVVRFARAEDDPEADKVWRKVVDGVIRNVSVGYRVHRLEKIEDGDDTVPVYRATDWEPYELSLVPMGADAGAGVRGADAAATNPCEVILVQERSMAKMKKDSQTRTSDATRADGDPEVPPPPPEGDEGEGKKDDEGEDNETGEVAPAAPPADGRSIDELATRRERVRALGIQRVGRALGLGDEDVTAAILAGTSLAQFRKEAIDMVERTSKIPTGRGPRVEAVPGGDARDKFLRGAGDALLVRSGTADTVIAAAAKRGETIKVDPGEFRGMRLIALARCGLERSGVRTAAMTDDQVIARVFSRASGPMATGDFPLLLENHMHKQLLANYQLVEIYWQRFCAVGQVSDFRAHKRYRMGELATLDLVGEGGEYASKALGDAEVASISAEKRGNVIAVTREMMINDDLDAMSKIPGAMGSAAKRTEDAVVFALLAQNSGDGPTMADSVALFHTSSHGANKTTSAAITVAALDLDRQAMAKQKDPANQAFLSLRPAVLLCGLAVGGTARVINESQWDHDSTKLQRPNMVKGMFRDIIDTPHISGNRRYLFADPSQYPTIEVAFLNGQREPSMASEESFGTDSIRWKVRHEFGVAAVDYRGAVTNAGG